MVGWGLVVTGAGVLGAAEREGEGFAASGLADAVGAVWGWDAAG